MGAPIPASASEKFMANQEHDIIVPSQVQMWACINLSLSFLKGMCCSLSLFSKQFHGQGLERCRIVFWWSALSSQRVRERCNNKHITNTWPQPFWADGFPRRGKCWLLVCVILPTELGAIQSLKKPTEKPPAVFTGLCIFALGTLDKFKLPPKSRLCFGERQTARKHSNAPVLWFCFVFLLTNFLNC